MNDKTQKETCCWFRSFNNIWYKTSCGHRLDCWEIHTEMGLSLPKKCPKCHKSIKLSNDENV